jgi:hypothetical protein
MEEFKTFIFQKDKKKARKWSMYSLLILLAIAGILYMVFIGIVGIGFSLIGSIFLIITLFKMKSYDDKYMGISAYGDRKAELIIAEEYFIIDKVKIPFSELEDLLIYVDEYLGKPREFMGVHHGGNNQISFKHKGKKVSFNYIIRSKSDFIQINGIVNKIEQRQKLAMTSNHMA